MFDLACCCVSSSSFSHAAAVWQGLHSKGRSCQLMLAWWGPEDALEGADKGQHPGCQVLAGQPAPGRCTLIIIPAHTPALITVTVILSVSISQQGLLLVDALRLCSGP